MSGMTKKRDPGLPEWTAEGLPFSTLNMFTSRQTFSEPFASDLANFMNIPTPFHIYGAGCPPACRAGAFTEINQLNQV